PASRSRSAPTAIISAARTLCTRGPRRRGLATLDRGKGGATDSGIGTTVGRESDRSSAGGFSSEVGGIAMSFSVAVPTPCRRATQASVGGLTTRGEWCPLLRTGASWSQGGQGEQ